MVNEQTKPCSSNDRQDLSNELEETKDPLASSNSPLHHQDGRVRLTMTTATTTKFIDATPYQWPYNGDLRPENTCIIVIDMQVDFCAPYVSFLPLA
jgi:hypothetical protein